MTSGRRVKRLKSHNNRYWPAVFQNLNKAWRWWGVISRVLTKTVATVRSRGVIYKALAQSVILYGSEIWVVMGVVLKVLSGIHHREARRITWMTAKLVADGYW